MARLNLSFIAVFLVLALCAVSLPTKRDTSQGLRLGATLEDLASYTKLMEALDAENNNDQDNEAHKEKPATNDSEHHESQKSSEQSKTDDQPTRTEKKPTSGKFVTPTVTNTHHPTSQPNMLGKLPLVGGLLGGTGGL